MRQLTIAVLQLPLARADESDNIAAVAALVAQAADQGAQVILPPELFSGEYFCREEDEARSHRSSLARAAAARKPAARPKRVRRR